MAKYKRRKIYVDPEVQGALIKQTVVHWACYLSTTVALLLFWQILTSGVHQTFGDHVRQLFARHTPVFCMLLLLLPALAWDALRLSHRFAGPFYRLRLSLRQLGEGEEVAPLSFREGDFWHNVAKDFNAVRSRIENGDARPCEASVQRAGGEETLDSAAELCGQAS